MKVNENRLYRCIEWLTVEQTIKIKWKISKRRKTEWSNRQLTNGKKKRIANAHSMEFQFLRPIVRYNKSVGLTYTHIVWSP